MYGRDARSAYMVLYIEPRTALGTPADAASLASWDQRLSAALKLPVGFASLLADELGMPTTNDPPAAVGVWLKAPRALTELVEVEGFDVVAGSPQSNWFMGVAIASSDGVQAPELVKAWLRQMCDSSLHLDNYEADIASLNGSVTGGRLAVRVVRTEWIAWGEFILIAAVQVDLANQTDGPVRIASVTLRSETHDSDQFRRRRQPSDYPRPALDRKLAALRTDRFAPDLANYRSVAPHASVCGWVTIDIHSWRAKGNPELEFTVREAVGTTYLTVIPRTDHQVSTA